MECPNCITPWKCNGPHLELVSTKVYKCSDGYFLDKDHEWVFLPTEKEFHTDLLMTITDTLRNLNEQKIINSSKSNRS